MSQFTVQNYNWKKLGNATINTGEYTTSPPIYRARNGVTIIAGPNAETGKSYQIRDEPFSPFYTVVDDTNIATKLDLGNDSEGLSAPFLVTTRVTNMSGLFSEAGIFNQNISGWDTSNVTDMSSLFEDAYDFNQNISSWDTSNVTVMSNMFKGAPGNKTDFNNGNSSGINNWNTGKVTNMGNMFEECSFNQPIGNWDTDKATSMVMMFQGANGFNQPIGNWDTSSVIDMTAMFNSATEFNQNISGWDVEKVVPQSGGALPYTSTDGPADFSNNSAINSETAKKPKYLGASSNWAN